MLNDIFYVNNSFQIKNQPVLEILYAMPHAKSDEIVDLLVTIIRSDDFCKRPSGGDSKSVEKSKAVFLLSKYMQLFLQLDYITLSDIYSEINERYIKKMVD